MNRIEIRYDKDNNIVITVGDKFISKKWPLVTFKEHGDSWVLGDIKVTLEEKQLIEKSLDKHFNHTNQLEEKNILIGNMLFYSNYAMEKRYCKLDEEFAEFKEAVTDGDKEDMIDELWDLWTAGVNMLQNKGIDITDIFEGYEKNLEKKLSRNYKFGHIK